jgi:hypothetical protein
MSSKAEVSAAIECLLAQLFEHVETFDDLRETMEIACQVRAARIPDEPAIYPSDIPALARATLMGAYVGFAARRATQQPAPSPLAPDHSDPCPQEQSKPTRGRLTTQDMQSHAA